MVKKMKYSKGIKSLNIFKNDIIDMQTELSDNIGKYLILKINYKDNYMDLLPIDDMIKNSDILNMHPIISIPFKFIKKIKKDKKTSLLFLINQNNPHILNAISSMI